jgi:hypothetical protein
MQSLWSRSRRRLRALARMSWSDRALVVESLAMLAAARVVVKTTPQRRLVSRIGGSRITSAEVPDAALHRSSGRSGDLGFRVGATVERVARFTWWRSMCLEKALAGKWMLRRRGIGSTMYVGMARRGSEFIAHAWLVGEGQTLTGAGNVSYAPLAAFREPERSGPRGTDMKSA